MLSALHRHYAACVAVGVTAMFNMCHPMRPQPAWPTVEARLFAAVAVVLVLVVALIMLIRKASVGQCCCDMPQHNKTLEKSSKAK